MNQSETLTVLEKLHTEFDISKLSYNHKNVWPIFRYYMALSLMKQEEKNNAPANILSKETIVKKNNLISVLKSMFGGKEYQHQKHAFVADSAETVFVSPVLEPYPDIVEGKKYSRYLDPYIETFSKKRKITKLQLTTGTTINSNHFIPVHPVDEREFFERNSLAIKISRRLRKKQRIDLLKTLDHLNDFCKKNKIAYHFNTWLIDHLDEIEEYEKLFLDLFKNSVTRVVFFECYYSPCIFGLISACKKKGIKTVDIQHGNVDVNYLGWQNVSTAAKYFLPAYYWVWSKADAGQIQTKDILQPVIGGNLWLKKFLEAKNEKKLVFENPTAIEAEMKILVSMQYSFIIDHILAMIIPVIEKTADTYFWMVRFHPLNSVEERNRTIDALEKYKNVEYRLSTECNLYAVLQSSDFHVVGSSAVAREGLQFNVPTAIVHDQGIDLYQDLIDQKVFCSASNSVELLNKIQTFTPAASSKDYIIQTSEELALRALETFISN